MGNGFLRRLRKNGWKMETTGGGHVKARPPGGGRFVIMASTPSDRRAIKNITAMIHRMGYELDGTVRKPKSTEEQVATINNLTDEWSPASVAIEHEIQPDEPVGAGEAPGATVGTVASPPLLIENTAGSGEGESSMESVDLKALGRESVEMRKAAGVSQIEVAKILGIGQSTMCNIEQGAKMTHRMAPSVLALMREKGVEGLRKAAEEMRVTRLKTKTNRRLMKRKAAPVKAPVATKAPVEAKAAPVVAAPVEPAPVTVPRPVEMGEQRIAVSEPVRLDGIFVAKGEDLTRAFRLDGKTKHVVVEGYFVQYITE